MGTMYRVHNILPGACSLHGYPGAMLLDRDFNSLPTHVATGLGYLAGKHAPVTVTLHGSHDAYFVLEWEQNPSPGQTCPAAKYIMVIAPNDFLPVVTYAGGAGIMACGGNLTASPVVPNPFSF